MLKSDATKLRVSPISPGSIVAISVIFLYHRSSFTKSGKFDLNLITLAYELKCQGKDVLICTYDYSIQNLANHLNLKYWGEKKIENRIEWIFRCKGCGKKYSNKEIEAYNLIECSVCGSDLQRTPRKVIPI